MLSAANEEAMARVEGAVALLRAPVEVRGRPVEIVFACGVAEMSVASGPDVLSRVLLAADNALERGDRLGHYTPELDRERDWRLSLAGELDRAMAAGDLWVAYQPKFDIRAGRITAAEGLVRWRHPERGNIPPDAFIPALEESGRILDLTLFVLERALQDIAAWSKAGVEIGTAVNISALLPADPAFEAAVEPLLERYPVPPGLLTFEVTESIAMSNPEAAIPVLERLAAKGIRLSIDDYGTGQSTLSYLKRLPAREIKIDKSFVQSLETSRGDQAMVRSTIQLAHELGFKVVAEGVETAAALEMLRTFGCDFAQGWHLGKPMQADDLARSASTTREAA
jgi:EAL domain-containing protein (putative c-di-GMP-specific phosphodiesterase class I)